jgi:hypothetical protein
VAPLPILCLLITLPHFLSYQIVLGDISGLRVIQDMALAFRSATHGQTRAAERALMGAQAPKPLVGPELRAILGDSPVSVLYAQLQRGVFRQPESEDLSAFATVRRVDSLSRPDVR